MEGGGEWGRGEGGRGKEGKKEPIGVNIYMHVLEKKACL